MGEGPMTGGGRGRCGGSRYGYHGAYDASLGRCGRPRRGFGRGFGGGFGQGWGNARWMGAPAPPMSRQLSREEELEHLKADAEYARNTLETINRRIEAIEKEQKPSEE